MKFNCIKDYIDRIPNCLICGKPLCFIISGYSFKTKKIFKTKLIVENDKLINNSLYDKKVTIDIVNNKIIDGKDLIYKLHYNNFIKYCKTCSFKINSNFEIDQNIRDIKNVFLNYERLIFYDKKMIPVTVYNSYGAYNAANKIYYIKYNNTKYYLDIDLAKFKDIKKLIKYIKFFIIFS